MTRPPFGRWFGWSVTAHVALGLAFWIVLPRVNPPSLPTSDAAVTVISLVDAPSPETPRRPAVVQPPPSRQTETVEPPINRSAPDLPTMDAQTDDQAEASIIEMGSTTPDAQDSRSDTPADPVADAFHPPQDQALAVQESDEHGALVTEAASADPYRPLVLAILERAKRYPLLAQRRGIEGTVEVAFLINPDGQLSDPELIASSSHPVLDEATLTMLHRVGSLPPPPDREPMRFPARIQYQIDQ